MVARINALVVSNSVDDTSDEALATQLSAFIKERFSKAVPPEQLRSKLIEDVHSEGHSGTEQLFLRLFRRGYYWPTMRKDISQVLQSCETCLKHNLQRVGYHPLQQLSASLPFDVVHLDLFGPLPVSSQGNKYTLLIVDMGNPKSTKIAYKPCAVERALLSLRARSTTNRDNESTINRVYLFP